MKSSKLFIILAGLICLLLLMLTTNPKTVILPILLVPFLLIGFLVDRIAKAALSLIYKNKQSETSRLMPVLLAFSVVAILLLSTLHQLTWKDTLLVLIFGILFAIYITRVNFIRR